MKILACLDLSSQIQLVVEKAVELAKWQKAELILLTVAEDFIDFGEGITLALTEQIKKQAEKSLESAGRMSKSLGVEAKTVMDYGSSPADSILTFAEKEGVDLIVMGSRAKTGLDRFLIGSVASKVVAHAKCSVLVIR
ncbi:MAG: universal stress protein [Desulfovibrio sp.]|jgi:nucleotide-binding universal stress UspA family protein|nr:universal stress protein [Desulfovibrio sp.]MBI4960046.1 universal stress protein [Desulfovibrio sp.]